MQLFRDRFPIPMRGNETADLSSSAPEAVGFPIPMRGNECSCEESIRHGSRPLLFPIPMRGNEPMLLSFSTNSFRHVSDPHEG